MVSDRRVDGVDRHIASPQRIGFPGAGIADPGRNRRLRQGRRLHREFHGAHGFAAGHKGCVIGDGHIDRVDLKILRAEGIGLPRTGVAGLFRHGRLFDGHRPLREFHGGDGLAVRHKDRVVYVLVSRLHGCRLTRLQCVSVPCAGLAFLLRHSGDRDRLRTEGDQCPGEVSLRTAELLRQGVLPQSGHAARQRQLPGVHKIGKGVRTDGDDTVLDHDLRHGFRLSPRGPATRHNPERQFPTPSERLLRYSNSAGNPPPERPRPEAVPPPSGSAGSEPVSFSLQSPLHTVILPVFVIVGILYHESRAFSTKTARLFRHNCIKMLPLCTSLTE